MTCKSFSFLVLPILIALPAVGQESESEVIGEFVLFDGGNAMRTQKDSYGVHALFSCHETDSREDELFQVSLSVAMPEGRRRNVSLFAPRYRETRNRDYVLTGWYWDDRGRFASSGSGLFKSVSLLFPPANPREELEESQVMLYVSLWRQVESEGKDVQIRIKLRNGTITHDLAYSTSGFDETLKRLNCDPYGILFN